MDYLNRNRVEFREKLDLSTMHGRFFNDLLDRGFATPVTRMHGVKDYNSLPEYYDKEKYKLGQRLMFKYVGAVYYAKVLGLISGLLVAFPYMEFTQQSNTPRKAMKRYFNTMVYILRCAWKTFNIINRMHRNVSRAAPNHQLTEFTQCHMAIAHVMFFVYVIARPQEMGIDDATREELEAFVHFWRVVGHLCGLSDEFNICRESYDETYEICDFIVRVCLPHLLVAPDPGFYQLATTAVHGLNFIWPTLHIDVMLHQMWYDLNKGLAINDNLQFGLWARLCYVWIQITTYFYRFAVVRFINNMIYTMMLLPLMFLIQDKQLL